MIGKKILINKKHPILCRDDKPIDIECLILDKILCQERITKYAGTSDGYYGRDELFSVIPITKYLICYDVYDRQELEIIEPNQIKKVLI